MKATSKKRNSAETYQVRLQKEQNEYPHLKNYLTLACRGLALCLLETRTIDRSSVCPIRNRLAPFPLSPVRAPGKLTMDNRSRLGLYRSQLVNSALIKTP